MNLEQAQLLKRRLQYLEGLIAWNSREYIWKVIIGPKDPRHWEHFRSLVNPSFPIDPGAILQPFRQEELTVYFFLKAKGQLICREYREFLFSNDLQVLDDEPATLAVRIFSE
ncbi:MAG: hypothetical protein J0H74_12610 [Chitinophagaceae bacterium]|nr:hypothetical protein [Chitinophagaceae bacterium]